MCPAARRTLVPVVVDALGGVLEVDLHNLVPELGVATHDNGPLLLRGRAASCANGSHVEVLAPLLLYPLIGEGGVHLVALLRPLCALGHHHQRTVVVRACTPVNRSHHSSTAACTHLLSLLERRIGCLLPFFIAYKILVSWDRKTWQPTGPPILCCL